MRIYKDEKVLLMAKEQGRFEHYTMKQGSNLLGGGGTQTKESYVT